MAVLTRGQVRTAIQQAIDDSGAVLWSQANLDRLTEMAEDTMFEAVLDTWPWFLSTSQSVAPNTSGQVALSTGLTSRFYRVLRTSRDSDGRELAPRLYTEALPQPAYYVLGDNLTTDPVIASPSTITVVYSFLPAKYTGLVDDNTALPNYPEGHEAALVYLTASWAMTKGDREDATQLTQVANQAVEALLRHIANRYPGGSPATITQVLERIMRNPIAAAGGQ